MARQARYVVQKAPHVDGPPIPSDEPCIVIRGQDQMALPVMDFYLVHYETMLSIGLGDQRVLEELLQHREAIQEWQDANGSKIADR